MLAHSGVRPTLSGVLCFSLCNMAWDMQDCVLGHMCSTAFGRQGECAVAVCNGIESYNWALCDCLAGVWVCFVLDFALSLKALGGRAGP